MAWARWLLPVPGAAEEEPILVLGDEATGGELEDEAAIELPRLSFRLKSKSKASSVLPTALRKWDTTKGGPGTAKARDSATNPKFGRGSRHIRAEA